MSAKVRVEHIYKIFGPSPDEAIKLLQEEADKGTILQKTENVVGMADAISRYNNGEHVFFYTWTPNWTVNQMSPARIWYGLRSLVRSTRRDIVWRT